MGLNLAAEAPPLAYDADGNVRVGGTRVTLDTIVDFFKQGHSPEQIAAGFPTVGLSAIYATIAYYLRHQDRVEAYLKQQEAEDVRPQDSASLRV